MNRLHRCLSACLLAATGVSAQAMSINPDGSGQVLLFPYYTANAGQTTVLSLVNPTDKVKHLQVTFREGYNSREVLQFNVILAPRDSWLGTVYGADATGPARLLTRDESCTVPLKSEWTSLSGGGYEKAFYKSGYTGANLADGGPATDARTREGHVEVIERAELEGTLAAAVVGQHPPQCTALRDIGATTPGLAPPAGGIYGNFAVIDVADGTLFGGAATAVADFTSQILFSDGAPPLWLAHGRSRNGATQPEADALVPVDGRLLTLTYAGTPSRPLAGGTNALSALLMTENLYGDISRETSLGSHSEWVITTPTRYLHALDLPATESLAQIAPFDGYYNDPAPQSSCTAFMPRGYDREGRSVEFTSDAEFSALPGALPQYALCLGTNVVYFSDLADNGTTPLLGSRLGTKLLPDMQAGHVQLELATVFDSNLRNVLPAGLRGPALRGLPVIAFEAVRYVNNNVGGVLSNYGDANPLRRSVSCGDNAGAAQACSQGE